MKKRSTKTQTTAPSYVRNPGPNSYQDMTREEIEALRQHKIDTFALLEARWEERQRKEQEQKEKAKKKP